MKKELALLVGLVAGTASFANSSTVEPSVSTTRLVMTTGQKVKLYVQPLQTKGQVEILDVTGQPLYNETVSLQKGLSQQFDVSNLSVGTYRLTLTAGNETVTKTFVVQADPNTSFIVQES